MSAPQSSKKSSSAGAFFIALGILFSRLAGLVRERVFAHYFGNSDAGDAFKAALKIPNFLQNLFGEGVLSASFIPVYARLLAEEAQEEAAEVASVVASLLFLATSLLVVAGVFATPWLIAVIAPGFEAEKKQLTIQIVQILFPGVGFLVLSAWCLGILNSHRRFFLSYVAPVVWNLSIIAALVYGGVRVTQEGLAIYAAWGLVAGSLLQFLLQLPLAWRLARRVRPRFSTRLPAVQMVLKNFLPAVFSRGVVQVSAYIDNIFASILPTGAVSALAYAQTIYLLPVSLFGMSISAAELPTMSQARGSEQEIAGYLRGRLNRSLVRIAFFIVPTVASFLFLGDLIVGALFQTGQFDRASTVYVWTVLAGATVGLLATTMARLYSSCFYSLKDVRTPLKFAILRVTSGILLGGTFAFYLPRALAVDPQWGTMGLTIAGGLCGWVEFYFLRRTLNRRIGFTSLGLSVQLRLWLASLLGCAFAWALKWGLPVSAPFSVPWFRAALCLGLFGLVYFILCDLLGIEQAQALRKRVLALLGKRE